MAPAQRFRDSRLATVVASLVVLAIVLLPGDAVPKLHITGLDKLIHFVMFFCWALALRFDWAAFRRRPALLLAAGALAGALTEAMQLGVPGRSFDLLDLAADAAGVALAAALGGRIVGAAERVLRLEEPGGPSRR